MSTHTVLGKINSSQEHELNPEVSESQYFAVSNVLQHISHIMPSVVERLVGLPLGTISSNVQREKQHPKNCIGVTTGPTFSFLPCVSSTSSAIDAR